MADVEIAVALSSDDLAALDRAVEGGHFASREEAIRQALRRVVAADESGIIDSYRRAYAREPEQAWVGEVGLALMQERVRREQD